jgi:hypothetical protein
MSWLDHRGTLKPEDVVEGLRVRVHYAFDESLTGTIVHTNTRQMENDNFADVQVDGYEGKLVIPALISEMDALTEENDPS